MLGGSISDVRSYIDFAHDGNFSLTNLITLVVAHCDGTYETPDRKERSFFTLHLYLNDTAAGEDGREALEGGATTFHSLNMEKKLDVVPQCGRVLMFQ
jgi:hypothetical protein